MKVLYPLTMVVAIASTLFNVANAQVNDGNLCLAPEGLQCEDVGGVADLPPGIGGFCSCACEPGLVTCDGIPFLDRSKPGSFDACRCCGGSNSQCVKSGGVGVPIGDPTSDEFECRCCDPQGLCKMSGGEPSFDGSIDACGCDCDLADKVCGNSGGEPIVSESECGCKCDVDTPQARKCTTVNGGVFISDGKKCGCKEDNTGGMADPHFTTWSKEHFDFQGECDLMLIDNPSFMEGLGMTVHGRTKLHGTWSAFASAAIKIGDDVLEVHGSNPAIINSKQHLIEDIKYGAEHAYTTSVGGYSLTVQHLGPHSRHHIIHFGNGEKIFINNFKEFVDFEVESPRSTEFAGSVGLLGSYNTGTKLARDGKTVIEDADEFGQEWQVHDTDTQLFSVVEGPQYPDKCNMPEKLSAEQRHLRAMTKKISEDQAKQACAKAPANRMENCIADVFGSDNLDMAGIYVH
mmetsp:Transcript_58514/g.143148  ORF Transcript_58514/g.143148 Transcript_58514/m.143148 type:complete len:460 (-) Transcript_58514:999-2378(-)|eukprot:CAMPEP_0113462560 /NCGR_PEP_ID=MMETSP0014_2-20120614/12163_1 /TAXON_ID=2857 /ORGANISM="Nitzschia sp." /LENGTH=459 /DNA_ID=CAMNT_0000354443 /DNA_START=525 /DNA_END=1904 /DNA_ORIENTATION=- /assembly_acc=CAM_ASM_000159